MQKTLSIFLFAACCFAVPMVQAAVNNADIQFLTDGVDGIGQVGVPGPLCVFGSNAAAVIAGKEGNSLAPLLAAATFNKGRVLAFGHGGYLSENMYPNENTRRLASNMFAWLAPNNKPARVAVVRKPGFADFIATLGFEVQKFNALPDVNAMKGFHILVLDCGDLPANRIEQVSQFISDGGGLLTASLGWGWLQGRGNTDLRNEHTGNRLLAPMGIVWADGTLSTTTEKDGTKLFGVTPRELRALLNVTEAMSALEEHDNGTVKLTPAQIAQVIATIKLSLQSIPSGQSDIFAPLKKYLDKEVIPASNNKIRTDSMIGEVIAITLQTEEYLKKQRTDGFPETGIPALAAGNDFPGAVPETARTVSKTVEVDTKIPDWHSTGLYAAPGSTVTVTVPKELAVSSGAAISVRIGCHQDGLWNKPEWL